jgi:diaminohydroxyphosphoribosylaminopyrimidine deaminase/5-amino-6-(5-phosphoribosylamino)uracil reductase
MKTEVRPEDSDFMGRALELAARGTPSPNPHVGAVVVSGGKIVGEGWHERAGEAHAEVMALEKAGKAASGATMYVTLEPCNHHGRTPPCTEAIIAAKIARVVVGCLDPNPHVEGGGVTLLRERKIDVVVGVREQEAQKIIAPWVKFVTTGLPFVTLKLALSLDGRIATRSGHSKWVTGQDARARVHALRAEHDAVGIGVGTALADDPRLTVREAPGPSPMRVVFDTKLRLPLDAHLVTTAAEIPTLVIASVDAPADLEQALTTRGVEVVRVPPSPEGRVNLHAAMQMLAGRGVVTLMIEGGAELAGSVLAARLVDELHAFIAPILLGPRARPAAVDWAGPDLATQAPRIEGPRWELCGDDAHVYGKIVYPD